MVSLECRITYYGEVADLLNVRAQMGFLADVVPRSASAITWHRNDEMSHDIQVVVIGQSGFGKSTLLNRLIGVDAFESNDIEACTRVLQSADFKFENEDRLGHISFCDLPGIGENKSIDEQYIALYRQIMHVAHAVIYVVRADQRDHAIDKWAFARLFPSVSTRSNLTIVINQIDKLPSRNQQPDQNFTICENLERLIKAKTESVASILEVSPRQIFAASATKNIGLDLLSARIGKVLAEHLSDRSRL